MERSGWLTSWGRIARYIGKSVRTAKRYHYQYGMPVRRGPGKRPVALEYELDYWLVTFDELMKELTTSGDAKLRDATLANLAIEKREMTD